MAQYQNLLLVENVDGVGIVGDIVKVHPGFARNFLLPRGLATTPSEELIEQLAERRREAEAERAAMRQQQEETIAKLEGYSLTMVRACNDQGQLYGSVTQHDIAEALQEAGFGVRDRDVRLSQTIKSVESYDVPIKFAADLETEITIVVESDRPIEVDEDDEDDRDGAEASAEDSSERAEAGAEAGSDAEADTASA